jgi:serine/threonine protein kinase
MAPEVIGGSHFPTACDMWSIGVIAYLLLCGYPPFSGETRDKLKWQIRHGTYKFHDSAWRHITPLAKR